MASGQGDARGRDEGAGKDIWAALVDAQRKAKSKAWRAREEGGENAAAEEGEGERPAASQSREARVVLVGDAQAGKTSILSAYLRRGGGGEDAGAPEPTIALDYRYTRQGGGAVSGAQSVTHYWELGGGRALNKLLEIALTSQSVEDAMAVVLVDLSRPHLVPGALQYWLRRVAAHARSCVKKLGKSDAAAPARAKAAAEAVWKGHADRGRVTPSLCAVTVVATKFDRFRDSDAECLRVMARTLRCFAHSYGASLVYVAPDSKRGLQRLRGTLSRHVLGGGAAPLKAHLDHTREVLVPAGADSFEAIGSAPQQFAGKAAAGSVEGWAAACRHFFPAPAGEQAPSGDAPPPPELEPEPAIDAVLAERNEELARVQRAAALQRKLKLAGTKPSA